MIYVLFRVGVLVLIFMFLSGCTDNLTGTESGYIIVQRPIDLNTADLNVNIDDLNKAFVRKPQETFTQDTNYLMQSNDAGVVYDSLRLWTSDPINGERQTDLSGNDSVRLPSSVRQPAGTSVYRLDAGSFNTYTYETNAIFLGGLQYKLVTGNSIIILGSSTTASFVIGAGKNFNLVTTNADIIFSASNGAVSIGASGTDNNVTFTSASAIDSKINNVSIMQVHSDKVFIPSVDLNIGTLTQIRTDGNITLTSPNGSPFNCGVTNGGVFQCT